MMAQPFDLDRLQTNGEMFPVVEQAAAAVNTGTAALNTSPNGVLAYWSEGIFEDRQFVWMDRAGKQLGAATKSAKLEMKFHGDLKLASGVCGIGAAEKR